MAYKTPRDIAKAGIATGATKAKLSRDKPLAPGDTPPGAEEQPQRREAPVGAR